MYVLASRKNNTYEMNCFFFNYDQNTKVNMSQVSIDSQGKITLKDKMTS